MDVPLTAAFIKKMKVTNKAPINRIIPFSNVDGPGNRLAIFFQTCPFSCYFCHNPETIHPCIHCGECVDACPSFALKKVLGKVVWNEKLCKQCDTCIRVCKHLSSPKIVLMGVHELMKRIIEIRPFIRGITVSGGECMNHPFFLRELFSSLRRIDPSLSLLIDSNGAIDFSRHKTLVDLSSGVMLDVKAFNDEFHKRITGISNKTVLKNLEYLISIHKLEEVRTVLFPTHFLENETTVANVARILKNNAKYKLLRYRHFGVRKEGIEIFGKCICEEKEALRCQRIAVENGCEEVFLV